MTQAKTDLDKYLATWPMFGLWGTTGRGKTCLSASLVDESHLHPVIMIDADSGGETSRGLEAPGVFERWTPDDPNMDVVALTQWLVQQVARVRTVDCGAVIVEGIGRIYSLFQGEAALKMLGNSAATLDSLTKDLDGNKGRASYKAGAALIKAVVTQLAMLRRAKAGQAKAGKRGGLVLVTLTTRFAQITKGGQMIETVSPELSKNATAAIMAESDGFFELRRTGDRTTLIVDADELCEFRKARNPATAARLAQLVNPTFGTILDAYAQGSAQITAAANAART